MERQRMESVGNGEREKGEKNKCKYTQYLLNVFVSLCRCM